MDRHRSSQLGVSILVQLLLVASLVPQLALSLSISSPSASVSAGARNVISSGDWRAPNIRYERQNSFQDQPAVSYVTTNLPPLITTQSQYNFIDSIVANSNLKPAPVVPAVPLAATNRSADYGGSSSNLRSSNIDDHDAESAPLATINNHRQLAALRPLQYVDVNALMSSSNRTASSSEQATSGSSLGYTTGARSGLSASGLVGKARTGLPECATQQVCNAIFVRMNYTQRLCECGGNYNWRCSHNLDPQDGHTIELTRKFDKRIYTQIKTCEPLRDVRACKSPTEWTLLALQSERSGKAHYVVVCKCPLYAQLEGPYTHNHPPYANIPGIRVYGMLCAHQTARSSAQTYSTYNPSLGIYPDFPWSEAMSVANSTSLLSSLDSD